MSSYKEYLEEIQEQILLKAEINLKERELKKLKDKLRDSVAYTNRLEGEGFEGGNLW